MSMPSSSERRRDHGGQPPGLELGLGPGALRAAHRAVVGARQDDRVRGGSRGVDADRRARLRRHRGGRRRRRVGRRPRPSRSAQTSFIRAVSRSAPRRELVNTRVERCVGDQVDDALLDVRPDRRPRRRARGLAGEVDLARRAAAQVVGTVPGGAARRRGPTGPAPGTTTSTRSSWSTAAGRRRPAARRPPPCGRRRGTRATASTGRTVADRPMRCAGPVPSSASSRSRRHGEVRAALGPRDRVDLVEDHRPHARQPGAGRRGEDQVERLGRGDEDVRRPRRERAALVRRGVAGADADRDVRRSSPSRVAPAGCPTSGERRLRSTSVGQRLERRHVQDPAALDRRRRAGSPGRGDSRPSSAQRNAASVLPDPVGATTSACWPGRRRSTPRPARSWARRTRR